jgi:hypothetical protein
MLKLILGAAVLTAAVSSTSAQEWASADRGQFAAPSRSASSEPVITHGQIARLKATLKLKAEQLPRWAAVESALHALAGERSGAVSEMSTKLRRLQAVAAPLIRTLDDNQRSVAIAFARSIGYGQLAASF